MTITKFTQTLALSLCLAFSAFGASAELPVLAVAIEKPAEGTVVMTMKPKISLSLLTAAGSKEPKVEWSENATRYLSEAVDEALKAKKYTTQPINSDQIASTEAIQILKLNDAVTDSIWLNSLPYLKLPTKKTFEWTLGQGATLLVPEGAEGAAKPRYVLFMNGEGSYSSGGRAAMFILAAAGGVAMPMGGQVVRATVVDLQTGQVVWYELMSVPSGTDIRTKEGATSLIATMFKNLPL